MFRKLACPFGQVKTKMYLPERPFFKNSLARAGGLVLMSVPDTFKIFLMIMARTIFCLIWHYQLHFLSNSDYLEKYRYLAVQSILHP